MKKVVCIMKYLLAALLCLYSVNAWAAPFVVCDPYPTTVTQPDGFTVILDNGASVDSPAQTVTGGKRLHHDISGVSSGSHTMRIKAYKNDAVWGRLESDEAVFTFVRPASPGKPAGIGLEP